MWSGSKPCSTCSPPCWINCAGSGRHTSRMRELSCEAADVTGFASAVSPGGSETVEGVTERRDVPVTVRRADVGQLNAERPAPEETTGLFIHVFRPISNITIQPILYWLRCVETVQ